MNHFLTLFKNTLHFILIPILMLSDIGLLFRNKTHINTNDMKHYRKNAYHIPKILLSTTLILLYYFGFITYNILGTLFPIQSKNAYLYLEKKLYHKECVVFSGINPKLEIKKLFMHTGVEQGEIRQLKEHYGSKYQRINSDEMLELLCP